MLLNEKIKISNSKNSLVMRSELQVKKNCYIKKKNLNLRNVVFVHKYILKMSDGMLCYISNCVCVCSGTHVIFHSFRIQLFSTCNVKMVVYIIDV